jgi:cystathionine beta-synthase
MMERGFLDPSDLAVADVLRQKAHGLHAVIFASPDDSVRAALVRMREGNVSQLPVIEDGRNVGSVEEASAMSRVLEDATVLDAPVRSLMGDAYPVVRSSERASVALEPLARRKAAVLVADNGSFTGVLTRFDFFQFLHK